MGTSNVATTMGLEYTRKSIGTEYSVSLAYVWVLDDHHPTMSMPYRHAGRSIIRRRRRIIHGVMLGLLWVFINYLSVLS